MLLVLNLDGTVRESLSHQGYITHPRDQQIVEGVNEPLNYFYRKGFTIVGVTNEDRVATNCKWLSSAIEEQRYTLRLLPQMRSIYFCPDLEGTVCYRVDQISTGSYGSKEYGDRFCKPDPRMIQLAIFDADAYLEDTLVVGDKPEDEKAANNSGVGYLQAKDWRKLHR
jgi:D-glycero-D-manno-heptose 1,7-bisphosphate phosphatase